MNINERIAAMNARIEAKKRAIREQEAQARAKAIRNEEALEALQKSLAQAFRPLSGLPLKPSGAVESKFADNQLWVVRLFWDLKTHHPDRDTLIMFSLHVEDGRAWIEHDDTEISIDVALDLAVAVVEARLDA